MHLWRHSGATLVHLWRHSGATLAPLSCTFGATPVHLWRHSGATLALLWRHFGATLAPLWRYYGAPLALLLRSIHKGILQCNVIERLHVNTWCVRHTSARCVPCTLLLSSALHFSCICPAQLHPTTYMRPVHVPILHFLCIWSYFPASARQILRHICLTWMMHNAIFICNLNLWVHLQLF